MNKIKIAAMILILGGGVLVAYFTVKNSVPAAGVIQTENETDIKGLANGNLFDWLNNSADKNIGIADQPTDNLSQSNISQSDNQSDNLTDLVAQSVFNGMKIMDQNGTNPFDSGNVNDSQIKEIIQANVNNLSTSIFNVSINEKDLKISQDNSIEAKTEYFNKIGQISQNRFGGYKYPDSIEQFNEDLTSDCFTGGGDSFNRQLAALYQNLTDDYMNLVAPSDLTDFHKQAISHLKKAHLVYQAVADCSKDPVKGYLAIQSLSSLVDKAKEIQSLLEKKYNETGLN